MNRYLKIYLRLIQLNFSVFTANRTANFVAGIIGALGWGVISVLTMVLLTLKSSTVYGWTRSEIILMTALYAVFIGIYHTIFSKNFERFSEIIHKGQLDGVLLKPIDSQFFLSLWVINYLTILRIIFGAALSIYMMRTMSLTISVLDTLFFMLLFICGLITVYSIWYIVITLTIWFSNLTNLVDFLYNVTNIVRYPSETITHAGNVFLFVLIPLMFVLNVPVKVFLHKTTTGDVFGLLIFTLVFFFISRFFWKFALRFYTSVSG